MFCVWLLGRLMSISGKCGKKNQLRNVLPIIGGVYVESRFQNTSEYKPGCILNIVLNVLPFWQSNFN